MVKGSVFAIIIGVILAVTVPVFAAVTFDDLTHKWQLGKSHALSSVASGDVFAVSPDHLRRFRVCRMDLDETGVIATQNDYLVRNFLGASLPLIWKIVPEAYRQTIDVVEFFDGSPVIFSLSYTELEPEALLRVSSDCEAELTDLINQRYKICYVNKSLVPTSGLTNFSGYSFYPVPIVLQVPDAEVVSTPAADVRQSASALECPSVSAGPLLVSIRSMLVHVEPAE